MSYSQPGCGVPRRHKHRRAGSGRSLSLALTFLFSTTSENVSGLYRCIQRWGSSEESAVKSTWYSAGARCTVSWAASDEGEYLHDSQVGHDNSLSTCLSTLSLPNQLYWIYTNYMLIGLKLCCCCCCRYLFRNPHGYASACKVLISINRLPVLSSTKRKIFLSKELNFPLPSCLLSTLLDYRNFFKQQKLTSKLWIKLSTKLRRKSLSALTLQLQTRKAKASCWP